ncbi:hypothetical protein GCM10027517_02850 [Phycicoccus ginsengisoli]
MPGAGVTRLPVTVTVIVRPRGAVLLEGDAPDEGDEDAEAVVEVAAEGALVEVAEPWPAVESLPQPPRVAARPATSTTAAADRRTGRCVFVVTVPSLEGPF